MKPSKPELPLRATLLYLLFGSIWILLSDQVLSLFVFQDAQQAVYQTLKGWFFIIVSSILLYILLHKDFAERKRAQDALRESEERFRRMFEKNPAVMMLIEPISGAIRNANQAAADFYGYSLVELCRMNINEINQLSPDDVQAERMRALHEERSFFNFQHRLSNGEIRFVEVHSAPIQLSEETLLFSIIHDATERRKTQQELQEIQNRMRGIVESAMDGIISINTEQRIVLANPAAEQMFGYGTGEMIGKPLDILLPERYRQLHREHIWNFGATHVTTRSMHALGTVYGRRASGEEFPAEASISQISIGSERIYTVIMRDITERKQAEEAVQQSKKRFQSLIEHAPDGIALLGMDGKLRQVTPSTQWILGYTNDDAAGQDPAVLTHPEDLPGLLQILQDLFQSPGATVRAQYRFRHKDGSWRWLESTISNLIHEPSVEAIIFNYRDVTEQKEAEKKLRESAEQYRSLFKNSPISLWVEDFSAVKQRLDQLREHGVQDMPLYLKQHPEFVRECMELIQILNVNSAAIKLYDAPDKSSLLGNILQIWPHLSPDQFLHELTQLADGQLSFEREATDRTLSGRKINVKIHWSVVPGYEETLAQVIVSTVDITDSKQAANRIQRQLQRLRGLRAIDVAISSSFDINVSLDVLLNEALTQLEVDAAAILLIDPATGTLNYAASKGFTDPAIEETHLHLSHSMAGRAVLERREIFVEDLEQVRGSFIRGEVLKKEGFASYFVTPLITKGEVQGVLEIFHRSRLHTDQEWRDFLWALTGQAAIALENAQLFENLHRSNLDLERRVVERTVELNRTNAELERANRAKDEFLATMSHELRTPLNSILGLSESLREERRGALNESQQNSLRIIETSGQHLLELINDILDLSKIEAGMFELYLQPVSVDEFCRSCLAFVRAQAIKKSITLKYNNETGIAKILADPRRLKQIFVNLLINAVKFTPEHGHIILDVKGDLEQDIIQFSVIDTGIGIAAQDLKRLFQPFVQVDSSLNRQYQGTGLGLALVQKLTDLHGGSVEVESNVGKGSRFTVNLIVNQAEVAKIENPTKIVSMQISEPARQTNAPMSRDIHHGLILLADDNPPNTLTMGEYLESYGYQVVTARDGFEAINKAQEINPDVILMDIQMPVMNGLEAISRLRADSGFASTPIIALTALAMPGDRERCLQVGADEYLSKPVRLKLLLKTIEALINQNKARS